jgi:hypothetical protein
VIEDKDCVRKVRRQAKGVVHLPSIDVQVETELIASELEATTPDWVEREVRAGGDPIQRIYGRAGEHRRGELCRSIGSGLAAADKLDKNG